MPYDELVIYAGNTGGEFFAEAVYFRIRLW